MFLIILIISFISVLLFSSPNTKELEAHILKLDEIIKVSNEAIEKNEMTIKITKSILAKNIAR